MKTTHFFKMAVLVTCFSLLLWNCQEDVIVTSQNKNITQPLPKYNIKTVSFTELQTNTLVQQKLKELKTILIKNRTTNTQKVYNVNTLNALFIENSQTDLHTYTFAVNNTENQTSLENVVLSKQPNGSYNAYAITYALSFKERSNLANGVPVNVLNKTTITPIKPEQLFAQNRGTGGCYKFKEVGIEDCSCHDTHASGGCTHPETIYEFVEVNCPGGAGNGISDGSGDSGTSDGLSGSGGGSNGGSTVTSPVDFQDPRCPAGSGKVLVNDICQCINGKVEDSNGVCNCPEGTIENALGKCIQDPCKTLKTLLSNPTFQAKLTELKGKVSQRKEVGYKQDKNGNYTALEQTSHGHSAVINIDRYHTLGYIHTHLNDYNEEDLDGDGIYDIIKPIRIFSPADVLKFLQLVRNSKYNGIPTHLVYGAVIASTGNYMLTFTGNIDDIVGLQKANEYDAIYRKYFKEVPNNEQAFLLFLKKQIKIQGIDLYHIKTNGIPQKITLTANETNVHTEDCE